jgi:two-component system, OmpR family, response regulator
MAVMTNEPRPRHILVVDDDPAVRTLLRDCLELDNFVVCEAETGAQAIAALATQTIDLVTLDLKLGGENGLEIARSIRSERNVPIVMITGKGDPVDRVVGLELGADDYIAKPFHIREVLARIRAVLRRYEHVAELSKAVPPSSGRLSFEGWVLDLDRRELRSDAGVVQELTTAEFNMLVMFVQRPTRVLSRDNIMDILKGHDWSPFDRSIDALIVRLRRKIEAQPDAPRLIKTVRGVGYAFAGDVRKA